MSREKEFQEQWQDFEKKIKSQWQTKNFDKISDDTQLKKEAQKLVDQELSTWHKTAHNNCYWLENLKTELPNLGEEFEAELKEVRIKQELKVPAKVKPKELSILGFGAFSALVVLLWGQNISSINWDKINLKQGLTAAGLLASGSYLFNKTRENRLANHYQFLKQQIMNDLEAHGKELQEITKKADDQTF